MPSSYVGTGDLNSDPHGHRALSYVSKQFLSRCDMEKGHILTQAFCRKEGDLEAWCYCKDQPFLGMGSSLGEYFWRFGFPLRMKQRDLRTVWSPEIPRDLGTITVIDKAWGKFAKGLQPLQVLWVVFPSGSRTAWLHYIS